MSDVILESKPETDEPYRIEHGIADCDIHPVQRSPKDLHPYLSERWVEHMETFGSHNRQALIGQQVYPRMMYSGQRRDAYPERGGPPGSDQQLMKTQHLDIDYVQHGMLVALSKSGMEERNLDYAAALSHAVNEWQLQDWVADEPRLHPGIVVPQENPEAAVKEIDERAQDPRFKQVIISPRSAEPLGRRRYWPIYEAAARHNLPVGWHPAAVTGGAPSTGGGWPTYYFQEHYTFGTSIQGNLVSCIFEGLFERFPNLRIVSIEAGFTWVPAIGWRMDQAFERMHKEVPHLKRRPSEYLKDHFWFATQPIEEPDVPSHLAEIIELIGWDKLLFSTDYPHWDFDDPRQAFKIKLDNDQRRMIFRDNAVGLYNL